jgi:acetyl-CoA carboxylase biotin carboxyl carrier protein
MPAKFSVDPELIRKLAEILNETGLGEIEYAEGDRRIRVARPAPTSASAIVAPPAASAGPVAGNGAASAEAVPPGAITSPMVGTVYIAASPGAPPFVKVGDRVAEGQTVLIIEAMKVMNPIKSPRAGTVRQVLVGNGAPVEYGEPLMIIE